MIFKKKADDLREFGSYATRAQFGGDDEILSAIGAKFYDELDNTQENESHNSNSKFNQNSHTQNLAKHSRNFSSAQTTQNAQEGANSEILSTYKKEARHRVKFRKFPNLSSATSPIKKIAIGIFSILFLIYVGIFIADVLFGKRSWEVLHDLQKEKAFLFTDIERLKGENADLQKTYLERQSLDPDMMK